MSEDVLFQWPAAAKFGRVVPKSKFYEYGAVSVSTRQRFVAEVKKITWAFKLADSTINLRGNDEVPEIQVFIIEAKDEDVSDEVLATIDQSVPYPVVFEINRSKGDEKQTRAAARPKESGTRTSKETDYFTTTWLSSNTERSPLPNALDLQTLYTDLLTPILPIQTRPGERLAETAERIAGIRKLEREIATLERRLRNEPQFNRKVDIRRELKDRRAALDAATEAKLTELANEPHKDQQWKS